METRAHKHARASLVSCMYICTYVDMYICRHVPMWTCTYVDM